MIAHWIGGAPRVAADGGRAGDVFDPATGRVTAQVPFADDATVGEAVAAARGAWTCWRDSSIADRTRVLHAFRALVVEHRDELARIVTSEHGKTIADARGEVDRGLEVVEFACGIGQLLKGEHSEQVSTGVDSWSLRQPLGVVAGITPFNFPVMVPMWMYAPAIACGNTFVLKPSERDPSASNLVARLWTQAGLPDGVFNVVHGDASTVAALLGSVDAVSFVGSTPVARDVHRLANEAGVRVQALGGAKNHMVVLPDADLAAAADAAVSAACGSAGERCMAVSVAVTVGDDVGSQLSEAVARRMRSLRVGPGDDPATEMGPLVTAAHRDRVASYIDAGVAEGAELVLDGRTHPVPADGFFLGPTLFDRVSPEMSVYRDEIFGPVLCIVRSGTFDDALELVNANPYGNGVALFTFSGAAARTFQREVQAGMVGINVPVPVPMAYHSFGGWKQSLFGDLHVYGPEGVRFYTRGKVVTSRWAGSSGPHLEFRSDR